MCLQLARSAGRSTSCRTIDPRVFGSVIPLAANARTEWHCQLTWDDAINYDHGMRLGRLTFDQKGNRLLPEATLAERENIHKYNWLVCEAQPNTVLSVSFAALTTSCGLGNVRIPVESDASKKATCGRNMRTSP